MKPEMKKKKTEHTILKYKLFYTGLILLVYLLGRNLPLYGIDADAMRNKSADAEMLLMQAVRGDTYRFSLFALGISPYMIASICIQMLLVLVSSKKKSKLSPKKVNRIMLYLMLVIAFFQAILHLKELIFADGTMLFLKKTVVVLEMMCGAVMILWLSSRNKKYGIGGQTALIFVNIIDGLRNTLVKHSVRDLIIPLLLSGLFMILMLILENTEKHIPLQRVSIHSIYSDKNYLAVKLNPIGVMPIMFSTAFFMIPQMIVMGLSYVFPQNERIAFVQKNLTLNKPMGLIVFIGIIYLLTIGFSYIYLQPKQVAEQFLESGDSFVGIHAGKETRRYFSGTVRHLALFSATVLSSCMILPFLMQYAGDLKESLTMLPSSFMILVGIWSNLYEEMKAVYEFDSYQLFF